jgi:hypothetical protein
MPITYVVDRGLNIVITNWTMEISAETVTSHYTQVLQDASAMNCGKSLADLREADLKLTGSEFNQIIARIVIPKLGSRRWTSAIVVQRPDQYGVARQYDVFASSYSSNSIFYDYDKALEWLLKA